jgi:hypothetical protein
VPQGSAHRCEHRQDTGPISWAPVRRGSMVIGMTKTTPPGSVIALGLWLCGRSAWLAMAHHSGTRIARAAGLAIAKGPMRSSRRARQGALPLPRRTFDGSPTAEGKARTAEAQRRRWAMVRRRSNKERKSPAFKEREEVAGVQRKRGSHLRPHDAHARVLVSKPLLPASALTSGTISGMSAS